MRAATAASHAGSECHLRAAQVWCSRPGPVDAALAPMSGKSPRQTQGIKLGDSALRHGFGYSPFSFKNLIAVFPKFWKHNNYV